MGLADGLGSVVFGKLSYGRLALLGFAVAAFLEALSFVAGHITLMLVSIFHHDVFPITFLFAGVVGLLSDLTQLGVVALITPYAVRGEVPPPDSALRDWRVISACRALLAVLLLRGIVSMLTLNVAGGVLEVVGSVVTFAALEQFLRGRQYVATSLVAAICLMVSGFMGASTILNMHLGILGLVSFALLMIVIANPQSSVVKDTEMLSKVILLGISVALILGGASRIISAAHALTISGPPSLSGILTNIISGAGLLLSIFASIMAVLIGAYALVHSLMRLEGTRKV